MKRTAALAFLFAVPAIANADSIARRMIVVTRHPFAQAERALRGARGDDFDFENRVRYNVKAFTIINGFAADLTGDEIVQLKKSAEVSYIEPVIERYKFGLASPRLSDDSTRALELVPSTLTDSIFPGQQTIPYGVTMVGAPNVWPVTRGKSLDPRIPTRVVVVDTGIDYNNPELKGVYKGGFNVVANNNDPLDDDGHGTHVAGTIAAADDGAGVVGIASQVELYSVKVLDECGIGSNLSTIDALTWITDKKKAIGGNWIANFSLGSNKASPGERSAFQKAADAGVLIFAASGNGYTKDDPTPTLAFPAGYPGVVSVGAIDSASTITDFSQRGTGLGVVAPGLGVLSTFVEGQLTSADGIKTIARFAEGYDDSTPPCPVCLSRGPVHGTMVFCGTGNPSEFPPGMAGKIALIERGGKDAADATGQTTLTFLTKSRNAKSAGAIGAIVYSIPGRALVRPTFSPIKTSDLTNLVPLALVSEADGARLKALSDKTVSLSFDGSGSFSGYDTLSGTSMACPHAVGVAALVWSVAPSASATTIINAMEQSAKDLGAPGYDTTYGNGLVNATDAAKTLNPAAFSFPVQPPPVEGPVVGRTAGRRGH